VICLLALLANVASAQGRLAADTLHSKALEKNLYGDSPDRGLLVYLPASYETSPAKRYPVVYLLHGFGGTERTWTSLGPIKPAMDTLVRNGAVREMIIVMPNGRNVFDGSFYTNSASTGNWDDFIAKELVAYIDGKYRTLARPESRGLAGHSMGGYGAVTLGMRHGGDVYGAVYSMSGCCTRFARQGGGSTWDTLANVHTLADVRRLQFLPRVMLAMSAAFAPNTSASPIYTTLPFVRRGDKLETVSNALDQWIAHEPLTMIPSHADKLKRLRGFMFDGGLSDNLVPPASLAAMDSAFTRAGVRHTYETYDGDHTNRVAARLATSVLPFFSRTLDFGDARR
jgi:S-formylglutathione hydrolase FrmB